jgi:hypothetical protein
MRFVSTLNFPIFEQLLRYYFHFAEILLCFTKLERGSEETQAMIGPSELKERPISP